jgi:hypothetical protein
MAMQYDPAIIYNAAERLYRRAAWIAFLWGLYGFVAGGLAGAAAGAQLNALGTGVLVGLVLGTAFGVALGIERGFKLRLEAQTALCHVKIEEHTRYVAVAHHAAQQAPR